MPTRPIKGTGAVWALAAMEGEADISPASLHLPEGQGSHIAPVLEGLKQGCPGCVGWEGGGQVQDAEGQVLLSPAAWLIGPENRLEAQILLPAPKSSPESGHSLSKAVKQPLQASDDQLITR